MSAQQAITLSVELSQRLEELSEKRDAETLTDVEYAELVRLSDRAEQKEAERMNLLAELAAIRQRPLAALMQELGLAIPAHG